MNKSLNETLSRTIITSGTIFIVLAVLLIFGGEVNRGFSFALTDRHHHRNVFLHLYRKRRGSRMGAAQQRKSKAHRLDQDLQRRQASLQA